MRDGMTLFGTPLRSRILLLVAALEETFAAEVARALGADYKSVVEQMRRMEEDGILAGLTVGAQRRVRLNFRYPEAKRLKELLIALLDADDDARQAAISIRRRPRARNKPL